MLFFGLLFLLIGGPLAWLGRRRLKFWNRINGTVIGVHEGVRESDDGNRTVFHAVIRYVDAAGNTRKILSDSGESSFDKIKIGTAVTILINPRDDSMTATVSGLKAFLTIGLVLLVVGVGLTYYGLSDSSMENVISLFVVTVLMAAMFAGSILPMLRLAKDPGMRAAARADKQQRLADAIAEADEVTEIEMSERVANEAQALAGMKAKAGLIVYPLRIIIGIALLVVAGPWSFDRLFELYSAEQTVGTVVGYGSSVALWQGGRVSIPGFHAVVEFQSATEGKRTLIDWLGTKSPHFANGEKVSVQYVAGTPGRATIDRGAWNWAPAMAILLLGILLIAHSLWKFLAVRNR